MRFSYMFERKGVIIIEKTDKTNEDDIMQIALEAGMDDMEVLDDSFYITTAVSDYNSVYGGFKIKWIWICWSRYRISS